MHLTRYRYFATAIAAAIGTWSQGVSAQETKSERLLRLWEQVDPEPKLIITSEQSAAMHEATDQACAGAKARWDANENGRGAESDRADAAHAYYECRSNFAQQWTLQNVSSARIYDEWLKRDGERRSKLFDGLLLPPPKLTSGANVAPATTGSTGTSSSGASATSATLSDAHIQLRR